MKDSDLNYLVDHRSDPSVREVLEDWRRDRGHVVTKLGVAIAADDADTADTADTADADDADTADTDAADTDDAADTRGLSRWLDHHACPSPGVKILKLPGGRYGWSVTRVGWVRRVAGDEYDLLPGARTIWRTDNATTSLDKLASDGPGRSHRLTDPQKGLEEINRIIIRRCLPASEEAWAEHCPKPKDWK